MKQNIYKELFPLKKPLVQAGKRLAATTMALSVLAAPLSYHTVMAAKPDQTGKHEVSIRILGTTDLHTNIYNYDYYKDAGTLEFGLAKTAALIKEARAGSEKHSPL